jgi:hypothetical protein
MIRRTFEYLSWFGNDRPFFSFLHVEPKTPWLSRTHTWEASGSRWAPTLVVRLVGRWALAWGSWQDVPKESVVKVRDADIEYAAFVGVNGYVDRKQWEEAWVKVKDLGLTPDEEMGILHEMGVIG